MKHLIVILLSSLMLFSCSKEDTGSLAPIIPPVETMAIDFTQLANDAKSATIPKTNWIYSATSVGIWNLIIGTTFAIPVASFRSAVGHEPTQINDLTWQWEYSVDGFTSQYTARLLGKRLSNQIEWKMYIGKTGIDNFEEFLWFEGTSETGGKSGQWKLNHSAEFPEETILIDWKKDTDEVGEIKYSYVRELNDQRQTDKFNGSTLTYGIQNEVFDLYVNIHAFNDDKNSFADTFIEWSRTDFTGHIKAEHFFGDNNWRCWDAQGNNIDCN
jgi:hypothetical protein